MVSFIEERLRASLRRILPLVRGPQGTADVEAIREAVALCGEDDLKKCPRAVSPAEGVVKPRHDEVEHGEAYQQHRPRN